MTPVSAQVSLYPLREPSMTPAIEEAFKIFERRGLDVNPGPMSTVVTGDDQGVFAALQEIYRLNADRGSVILNVTFSNACPTPGS